MDCALPLSNSITAEATPESGMVTVWSIWREIVVLVPVPSIIWLAIAVSTRVAKVVIWVTRSYPRFLIQQWGVEATIICSAYMQTGKTAD